MIFFIVGQPAISTVSDWPTGANQYADTYWSNQYVPQYTQTGIMFIIIGQISHSLYLLLTSICPKKFETVFFLNVTRKMISKSSASAALKIPMLTRIRGEYKDREKETISNRENKKKTKSSNGAVLLPMLKDG